MSTEAIVFTVVGAYFVIVLAIGAAAYRKTSDTAEDYFLGGRVARSVVLFMSLFGTNITPFLIMGISGLAYHAGIGVFGYNAVLPALLIPLVYYAIGYPAWIASRATGAVTPAELFARRFNSPNFGRLMFAVYFIYTLPYMATGVVGVGLAVDVFTHQLVSFDVAAAGIIIITIAYTSLGGMRATMWTNVFQGLVFGCFLCIAFLVIATDLGGPVDIMQQLAQRFPELLSTGNSPPFHIQGWISWGLAMGLTVIAFPHLLVRVFAAKDVSALKNSVRYYPLIMIALMLVTTLFGIWGRLEFPDFVGRDSDLIFPMLIQSHFGPVLQGLALASILAAVMSTLDAQMLTLSSMLTRDVWHGLSQHRQVVLGRVFLIVLAGATYLIVLQRPASIFTIAQLAFSGYTTLVPVLFMGLRWRRFNGPAGIASILAGNIVLIAAYNDMLPLLGFLPVFWGFVAATVTGIIVPFITAPTSQEHVDAVMGPIEEAAG
ncbi:MAG: sodium:solute symporter family protein [Candidatus Latescibacteria bacterium]|nr:sodium:solute symporter family protein [Candidatus Latescibacterota bacterium]